MDLAKRPHQANNRAGREAARRDDTRWILIDRSGSVHARVTAEGHTNAERFAWAIVPELAGPNGGRVVGWLDATNDQRAAAKSAYHITQAIYAKQQRGNEPPRAASGRAGGAR